MGSHGGYQPPPTTYKKLTHKQLNTLFERISKHMDTSAINQALIRERTKLERQLSAIEATKALIQMLESELTKTATTKK